MDDKRVWTDYIAKGSPARRDFPRNPPNLHNLNFLRIVIAHSRVHVVVRFSALPDGTPARWIEKKYHELDLVFQFDLPKVLLFEIQEYMSENFDAVSVIFEKNLFTMLDNNSKTILRIAFKSVYAIFVPDEHLQFTDLVRDFSGSDLETY